MVIDQIQIYIYIYFCNTYMKFISEIYNIIFDIFTIYVIYKIYVTDKNLVIKYSFVDIFIHVQYI